MKRKYLRFAVLTAVLAGILGSASCGHQAPEGQSSLQNLTVQNLGEIKNDFNSQQSEVRVLLLLSPT